ncbi:hypothetical protein [Methylocaldum szegediense]|uniref:Lipoprotein n=2 Tax=Methylocaldum szegediense TaxID=73780 RepID=A0ABM9HWE8_9GAMM|nr:hypothetical protein [Methylocaldum szegediense]CAI8731797.1 conserved protein of unknown function [Methylocaldum szegediense]
MELRSRRPAFIAIAWPAIPLLLMACRDSGDYWSPTEPVPLSAEQEKIASDMAPIRIDARPESWPGGITIEFTATPLRLEIENRGSDPVLIRYSDFKVYAAPTWSEFSALPVFPIESKDTGPVAPGKLPRMTVQAYPPIRDPLFQFRNFRVAPYLRSLYPDIPVHDGPFPYDRTYNQRLSEYWQYTKLPNLEMMRRALPEGVLYPAGWLEGWLYFQKFEPMPAGTLVVSLTDTSGRAMQPIRIPIQ